jgi:hypothetical protein
MVWEIWKLYRSAVVTAEALAWHHGKRGVEMARSAAEGPHSGRMAAFQARLVADLTADRYECIRHSNTSGRYNLAESWARRRGQMIR